MKYFVTGAIGFVGSHVVHQLVAQGHEVVVSVRTPAKAKELAELDVTITQGDVIDKESIRAPTQGVDGVFHIAGWYKVGVFLMDPSQKVYNWVNSTPGYGFNAEFRKTSKVSTSTL